MHDFWCWLALFCSLCWCWYLLILMSMPVSSCCQHRWLLTGGLQGYERSVYETMNADVYDSASSCSTIWWHQVQMKMMYVNKEIDEYAGVAAELDSEQIIGGPWRHYRWVDRRRQPTAGGISSCRRRALDFAWLFVLTNPLVGSQSNGFHCENLFVR
jgi:hypothetical protein